MAKRRANGEGSIYPRTKDSNGKPTSWAAQYTDNTGKKRYLYGKTQQIVKDKLKEAMKQSDKGISMDRGRLTFADWLLEWLELYSNPTCRKSTYATYYHILHTHIVPAFPKILLKDLRIDMLQKFFNEKAVSGRRDGRDGGVSANYLRTFKIIISTALKQAECNGLIATNLAKRVKLPPAIKTEIKALTREEQAKLEEAIENDRNPLSFIILLDLYTGLRIGELIALKISDIDLEKQELHVRSTRRSSQIPGTGKTEVIEGDPKTEKGKRTVPLNNKIIDRLRKYLEYRQAFGEALKFLPSTSKEDVSDYLFLTQRGTVPEYTTVRAIFVKLIEAAGIRLVNIHVIRHTFATRAVENGFDIKTLADILGHENATMTLDVYSHSMENQKRTNMEKLSNLFALDECESD